MLNSEDFRSSSNWLDSSTSTNDENTLSCAYSQKQLVIYESSNGGGEIKAIPDPISK